MLTEILFQSPIGLLSIATVAGIFAMATFLIIYVVRGVRRAESNQSRQQ